MVKQDIDHEKRLEHVEGLQAHLRSEGARAEDKEHGKDRDDCRRAEEGGPRKGGRSGSGADRRGGADSRLQQRRRPQAQRCLGGKVQRSGAQGGARCSPEEGGAKEVTVIFHGRPKETYEQVRIPPQGVGFRPHQEGEAPHQLYGLKNTREIWRMLYALKKARSGRDEVPLAGRGGTEGAEPLMRRLARMGIVGPDAKLDDVLSLSVENFLDRRLQTRVMKKGLARTARQARQLITHGYIAVKGRRVTIPSYIVTVDEDQYIAHYKPIDISVHVADDSKKPAKKIEEPPEAPAAEAAKPSEAG